MFGWVVWLLDACDEEVRSDGKWERTMVYMFLARLAPLVWARYGGSGQMCAGVGADGIIKGAQEQGYCGIWVQRDDVRSRRSTGELDGYL